MFGREKYARRKVYYVFVVTQDGMLMMGGQFDTFDEAEDKRREISGIVVTGFSGLDVMEAARA